MPTRIFINRFGIYIIRLLMLCPKCHKPESKVLDSRPGKSSIRRRRQCENCGYRFSTVEEIKIFDWYVEKRNGSIMPFLDQKLFEGIRKAFNKRTVDETKINLIVQNVIEEIIQTEKNPIKSVEIGQIVLKCLREVDEAAFVCFSAMFGNFSSIKDFEKALKEFEG